MSAATASPGHAAFGHRRCGDVDDQAALLRGWNQDYAQMSAGAFTGEISDIWLQDLHLFTESTDRRLRQRGALPASHFAIGLPLAMGDGPVVFCGASDWGGPQAEEHFCTFSGSSGFEFFTPAGLMMAGVEFDWAELLALADESEQAALQPLSLEARLHSAPAPALSALREMLQAGFSLARSQPELLTDPVSASALRKSVLSNVIDLLLSSQQQPGPEPTPERAWKLVARAQAHLRQDPETPHTVADLCRAVGASRRTLQNAFQRVLDMPPHNFLRALRLAGARRSLRSARSVAEAATRWGFWHLGLFAQDYKHQFGELPSITWRRHHPASSWEADRLH